MKPKYIPKVCIKDSHVLSAMELNKERFQPRHTVLTPELVEELVKKRSVRVAGTQVYP